MGIAAIWDKEAKNLLTSQSIDYKASPFRLKDPEFVHCTGFVDLKSDDEWMFGPEACRKHEHVDFIMEEVDELIGHNTINYDHLLEKIDTGLNYSIGCTLLDIPDTVTYKGKTKEVKITDTLVMSKTLNPDRPQHSIAFFGSILGLEKIDWRAKAIEIGLIEANAPRGAEFRTWHPEMGIYMMRDCHVNKRVYNHLIREWGTWDWDDAYELEKGVAEIITRQEHRGFWFNREKAVEHVKFLDTKMEELRQTVEPLIPPKPLTKGDLADVTPLKTQFLKKTGEPVSNILKFAKKHGSEFVEVDGVWTAEMYGKKYTLPMPHEPMYTTKPAKLDDTLHIKEWLVELGWVASQYKERDLTVDSKKKKLTKEKFDLAVDKWVEQTFASPFKKDRLFELDYTERVSKEQVIRKLKSHDHMKRPLIVYTNPTLTVGMEKAIDENLLKLSDKFAYAKEISDYLTYKHRRNSILGGGIDPDDDEDMQKGWLSVDRITEDGRIPTPADTCGAATSRFKHRLVANIPRVSSKFGKEMRELFGADVDAGYYQIGYDFDSLEAKVESHYVFRYEGGIAYGESLTAKRPLDCHSVLAASITELLGRPFPRSTAKNVKYGCSYNAQVARVAKTVGCTMEEAKIIFDAFWEQAYPLKQLKEAMQVYWETTPEPATATRKEVKGGNKKWLIGIDKRKLPIRSKGNVINTAFQSCGVICAKRAMVLHDRMLKDAGIAVDFFTDDWKAKKFCQQMVAYHDECQLEVSKELVTFKKFKDEEEANAFKSEDGKIWSEVIHNDKGYFRAYTLAGELAAKAVKMSGEYYKLNVELTAGYNVGRNWAECH